MMETIAEDSRKKVRVCIVVILCLSISFSALLDVRAGTAPQEVVDAARNGLYPFLERILPDKLENYGFTAKDRLDEAELDTPFAVYTITPSALSGYKKGDTVSSLLSPTGMWYFPIMIDGDMRSILTVSRLDGSWKAVAMGQASLAVELKEILRQWPRSLGYEPQLVMVFQVKSYFFTIPQKDDYNLTPFSFDRKFYDDEARTGVEKYSSTSDVSALVNKLKATVEEGVRQGK